MFTGLIEAKGKVLAVQKTGGGARFSVSAAGMEMALGDSIAVNGTCVTVVEMTDESFTVDLVPETLAKSNLSLLKSGDDVNLERAMVAGGRFGGHWVQGHVDCMGQVRSRRKVGNEEIMEVIVPFEVARFIVDQGSITIDGVSLTVLETEKDRFKVALIPFTREMTTLGKTEPMAVVNLELDVISKYVDKHMSVYLARMPRSEATDRSDSGRRPERVISRQEVSRSRTPKSRAVFSAEERRERSVKREGSRGKEPVKRTDSKRSDPKSRSSKKTRATGARKTETTRAKRK